MCLWTACCIEMMEKYEMNKEMSSAKPLCHRVVYARVSGPEEDMLFVAICLPLHYVMFDREEDVLVFATYLCYTS